VLQAHCTVDPTITVFEAGLNVLLLTVIPPEGGAVLPPGVVVGLVESLAPLPPQAKTETTASDRQKFFIILVSVRDITWDGIEAREPPQAFCATLAADYWKPAVRA